MSLLGKHITVRAIRKARRSLAATRELMRVLVFQGSQAAYHACHELGATRKNQWSKLHSHLRARLNLLGAHRGRPLNAVFRSLECRDVSEITYEPLVSNEVADKLRTLSRADTRDLYSYFRYFGDFRIANVLRIRLLERCVAEQMRDSYVSPDGLNAALELGKPQLVLHSLAGKKVRLKDRAYVGDLKAMALGLIGDVASADVLWRAKFREGETLFREMMEGRSVALVGPAPPEEDVGPEIDSYDFVVRTNYRIGSNNPVSHYGARTDISYYNHASMALRSEEVIIAAKHLRWTVLKSEEDDARFRTSCPDYKRDSRATFLANSLFFYGAAPMAIQNILYDLIRFAPARLKLFCTTFYSSRATYNKDYRTIPLGADTTSNDLRIHEPFSGFTFVQNLHRAELCTLDQLTAGVIGLSREQYAENLQKLYGEYILH